MYHSFIDTAAFSATRHEALQKTLRKTFNIPRCFCNPVYLESNGHLSVTESLPDLNGQRTQNISFRFLSKHASSSSPGSNIQYRWDKLGFCTQWRGAEKSSVLLCFDIPDTLKEQINQELLGTNTSISTTTPFAFASFLLPFIVLNFDTAVWSCRDLVRDLEHHRPEPLNPRLEYARMHEITRQTIHSTEMLGTSVIVLDCMIADSRRHSKATGSGAEELEIERDLNFHRSMLKCLQLRSAALDDRLRNEINLVSFREMHTAALVANPTHIVARRSTLDRSTRA